MPIFDLEREQSAAWKWWHLASMCTRFAVCLWLLTRFIHESFFEHIVMCGGVLTYESLPKRHSIPSWLPLHVQTWRALRSCLAPGQSGVGDQRDDVERAETPRVGSTTFLELEQQLRHVENGMMLSQWRAEMAELISRAISFCAVIALVWGSLVDVPGGFDKRATASVVLALFASVAAVGLRGTRKLWDAATHPSVRAARARNRRATELGLDERCREWAFTSRAPGSHLQWERSSVTARIERFWSDSESIVHIEMYERSRRVFHASVFGNDPRTAIVKVTTLNEGDWIEAARHELPQVPGPG